ncbi:MAG: hypothetical protein IJI46_00185 [Erysipelotrichaceae bacterium]|nr:hypothetical protein [Erysipelotrichaceae bacterium]
MLLCLVGCDKKDVSSSKYIGTWEATDLSLLGEKEAFQATLVLNGDGSSVLTADDDATNCSWVEIGNGIKLKGDAKVTFKANGDKLEATILGAKLSFERK